MDLIMNEQPIYTRDDFLVHTHISDLHFNKVNPEMQYAVLVDQYINPMIAMDKLDIIAIDGDLTDTQTMTRSKTSTITTRFMSDIVTKVAQPKNAAIVITHGTWSHDANQYNIFKHYAYNSGIEFYIADSPTMLTVKGRKILCLPDVSGVPEHIYDTLFHYSGLYDACFFHGTVEGCGVPSSNCRLLKESDFYNCTGPIIGGHIHVGGCVKEHIYYNGCPYPMDHADVDEKGFLIVVQNLKTHEYMVHKQIIHSWKYRTLVLDDMVLQDPKFIIDTINRYKQENDILRLRVQFFVDVPVDTKLMLSHVYKDNSSGIDLEFNYKPIEKIADRSQEAIKRIAQFPYLYEKGSPESKFARWVNDHEGCEFTTANEIKEYFEKLRKLK